MKFISSTYYKIIFVFHINVLAPSSGVFKDQNYTVNKYFSVAITSQCITLYLLTATSISITILLLLRVFLILAHSSPQFLVYGPPVQFTPQAQPRAQISTEWAP